jgi:putative oxidoreductase
VLAASLIPTTAAGHRFWEVEDKAQRSQQKLHFFKNLSVMGGLIIAAGDTEGKPGVAWRTRRVAKDARREAKRLAHDARRETKLARARIS